MANRGPRKYTEDFSPSLGEESIPALSWENRYKYLGCNIGADPMAELKATKAKFCRNCESVLSSLLTDWQKLERFLKPRLDYHLSTLCQARSGAETSMEPSGDSSNSGSNSLVERPPTSCTVTPKMEAWASPALRTRLMWHESPRHTNTSPAPMSLSLQSPVASWRTLQGSGLAGRTATLKPSTPSSTAPRPGKGVER